MHTLRDFIERNKREVSAFGFTLLPDGVACRTDIKAAEKLVYSRIRRYGYMKGGAFPSNKKLAVDLGLSERTVQRITVALAEKGLLQKDSRPGQSNIYRAVDSLHALRAGPEQEHREAGTHDNLSPPAHDNMSSPPRQVVTVREKVKRVSGEEVEKEEKLDGPGDDLSWLSAEKERFEDVALGKVQAAG